MSKIEDLIKQYCPDGVEWKRLGDTSLFRISRGVVISKSYIAEHHGQYPVYSSQTENDGCLGCIDTYAVDGERITWTTDGAKAGTVFYRSGKYNITNVCGMIECVSSDISCKYVSYVFGVEAPKFVNKAMGNCKLMSNVVENILIPIPHIAVQDEIVRILDKFTELEKELEKELELRRKQYEFYRDELLTFGDDVERKKLGDVCSICTDYTAAGSFAAIAKNVQYLSEENYALLVRTMDIKSKFSKGNPIYVDKHAFEYLWRVQLSVDSIILPNIGNCGEVYYLKPQDIPYKNAVLAPNAILLRSENCNMRFLYYILQSSAFQWALHRITTPGGQTKFNKTDLKKLEIPVPSPTEQERIVKILDKFNTLTTSLTSGLPAEIKLRKQQYEYYRDYLFGLLN